MEEIQSQPVQTVQPDSGLPERKPSLKTIVIPACRQAGCWIAILLIAGAVYAGIQIGKKQTAGGGITPKITPTVAPQPTSAITNETANWKTYRNSKYGFEVKYPPELEYYSSQTDKVFNIDYPGMSDVSLFTITCYETKLDPQNWWDQMGKKDYPWLFNTAFNKIEISKESGELSGIHAIEIVGQRKSPGGATLSDRILMIKEDNLLFVINGSSLTGEYGQILSTFKFID